MSNVAVKRPAFHEMPQVDFFKLVAACDRRALKEQQGGSVFPQSKPSKKVTKYKFSGTARKAIKDDKIV